MTNILKTLDVSAQNYEVQLLERHGRQLWLESATPIAPGTAAQLSLDGETLVGEVVSSISRCGHFELAMQAQDAPAGAWLPNPAWGALDSEQSVVGSLAALNARLVFYENQWQSHRNGMDGNLRESS